ncbi:MAG: hypothetical protein PHH86_06300 [Sphaerochaetaceae bacterium]|nr:hypothetical protein [Sphaerochaetaceae bacterium]
MIISSATQSFIRGLEKLDGFLPGSLMVCGIHRLIMQWRTVRMISGSCSEMREIQG